MKNEFEKPTFGGYQFNKPSFDYKKEDYVRPGHDYERPQFTRPALQLDEFKKFSAPKKDYSRPERPKFERKMRFNY